MLELQVTIIVFHNIKFQHFSTTYITIVLLEIYKTLIRTVEKQSFNL